LSQLNVSVGDFGRGFTVTESEQVAEAATTDFDCTFDRLLSTPSARTDFMPTLTSPGARQKTYSSGLTGKAIAVALGSPEGASAMKIL